MEDKVQRAGKKARQPRIGVVQMTSSSQVDISLNRLDGWLSELAKFSPDIILLPENFAALGADNVIEIARMGAGRYIRQSVAEMARRTKAWIVAGSIPLLTRIDEKEKVSDGRVRAACLVFDDRGKEVARYDKIHMFDVDVRDSHGRYRESDTFEPGDQLSVVGTPAGSLGLTICYDIRFPEIYHRLSGAGAKLFSIPSAFTRVTGAAHFELLMRARAVENQCYTIAACQTGRHDSGRETWGHSMVVNPWGDVVASMEEEEGIFTLDLEPGMATELNASMPVRRHRRKVSELPLRSY